MCHSTVTLVILPTAVVALHRLCTTFNPSGVHPHVLRTQNARSGHTATTLTTAGRVQRLEMDPRMTAHRMRGVTLSDAQTASTVRPAAVGGCRHNARQWSSRCWQLAHCGDTFSPAQCTSAAAAADTVTDIQQLLDRCSPT
eukprot:SAG22_NODE_3801_length_1526_cov_1.814296_1_plen_140_part_10